jgi:uncharacterized protein YggE
MTRFAATLLGLLGLLALSALAQDNLFGLPDSITVGARPGVHTVRPLQASSATSASAAAKCNVPGGLDCGVYTSLVSAAAAAAVAATSDARQPRENLVVQGRGSARAPVSRAQFTVTVEVNSADVHKGALQDIAIVYSGPYGEVEKWSAAAVEQAMSPARKNEVLFCASCVNREAGRRVTSVLNYLSARNATFVREAGGEQALLASLGNEPGNVVGIAPPRTTSMSLTPQYDWANNERRLASYSGRSSITVDVPMPLAAEVMDGVLSAGATSMSDVTLAATPAAMSAAQMQADRAAATTAVTRAQNVLSALKVTGTFPLTRVSILGGGAVTASPVMRMERAAGLAAAPAAMSFDGGFGSVGNAGAAVGEDIVVEASVEIAVSFGDSGNARVV